MSNIINYSFVFEQFLKKSKIDTDAMHAIISYVGADGIPYHFEEHGIIKCSYYNIYYESSLYSSCPVCELDKVSCNCEYDCKCGCRCFHGCICKKYEKCKCVYGCNCYGECECSSICICPCCCEECCYCDCRCKEECKCLIKLPLFTHYQIMINNKVLYKCGYGIYHDTLECILTTKYKYK